MTLYIASTNPGKLRELATSAHLRGIEVLPLPGLDNMPVPVEDAVTFSGNADLKARAYSLLAPGLLVLADDSGLEIDALDGRPGVHSARFADDLGFEANTGLSKDERNNRCVLALMQQQTPTAGSTLSRQARFICALALARDGKVQRRSEGSVEGELLPSPQGADGFGYDPLFYLPDLGKTMAELSREEKWAVSHRGQAFRALLSQL